MNSLPTKATAKYTSALTAWSEYEQFNSTLPPALAGGFLLGKLLFFLSAKQFGKRLFYQVF